MYFMPAISILLSITINTIILAIDYQERNNLSSLSRKIECNASFISQQLGWCSWLKRTCGYFETYHSIPVKISTLSKITKAINTLGILPSELFPAVWCQLIGGSTVFNCFNGSFGYASCRRADKTRNLSEFYVFSVCFCAFEALETQTAFSGNAFKRIIWFSIR